jgi:2-polyprenyl-6-methoxyphenol hydroxylase-like FAD-dependent oxidoreductase
LHIKVTQQPEEETMENKSVLISGVGVAGPTLAYWLLRYGFQPTLVEHAPRLRDGGYILDFWGLGYAIAERMGLLPEVERAGYHLREFRLVDSRGRRVGGFDARVMEALSGGRFISIARSDLSRLLYQSVATRCDTIFGDTVTQLAQSGDGVDVHFAHAEPRRFDLVIGAGGLHSPVRSLVFGKESEFETYLGYTVAAFTTDSFRPRDEDIYLSHSVPGRQVARFSLRGGRTMFLFIFTTSAPDEVAPHETAKQKAILRREFADGGWECSQILDALDDCDDLYFDRVSQIHLPRWSEGRVALVGDAAFCPSLLAGQGSALAMTAAYVLAGELAAAGGDHTKAFPRYEDRLRTFIERKQRAAQRFGSSFAPKTALGIFVRNQITRTLNIRWIAKSVIGRDIRDRMTLPAYPGEPALVP